MSVVEDSSVAVYRDYIKGKLMASVSSNTHHGNEKAYLLNLIEKTVKMGESNSALVVGFRSYENSDFVNSILSELRNVTYFQKSAVVVRLHGFVHTDDAVALKAITHQMGLSNKSGDRVFGSFAENLSFLLECLRTGDRESSKCTIVILEEFDQFCCRVRQTLLYNLFDAAQSANAPVCVLGITCRTDATDLLEKRVKSRFSNRQIYLFPEGRRSGFQGYMDFCQDILSLPRRSELSKIRPSFIVSWNKKVKHICSDTNIRDIIQRFFHIDLSKRQLQIFLSLVVSKLDDQHKFLEIKDFVDMYGMLTEDSEVNILQSLSVLELCLIIAMKHHTDIYDDEPFNFEMVLGQYMKFINRNLLDYTMERTVIMKAFENIVNLELVVPIRNTKNTVLKDYQMFKLSVLPEQIKVGVNTYKNLPTEVKQWAKSSI